MSLDKYTRKYDHTDKGDQEFDLIAEVYNEVITKVNELFRDDGKLKDCLITKESLGCGVEEWIAKISIASVVSEVTKKMTECCSDVCCELLLGVSKTDTTLKLVGGCELSSVWTGEPYYIRVKNTTGLTEIMKVIDSQDDSLVVKRNLPGMVAQEFKTGDKLCAYLIPDFYKDWVIQVVDDLSNTILPQIASLTKCCDGVKFRLDGEEEKSTELQAAIFTNTGRIQANESNIQANESNIQANESNIQAISTTQNSTWTGLDSLPVGSISPLLFSATGMSEKWTFANGSKIPETQPIIDWFNNDTLGFIANWNSTCASVGATPITLADGFLTVPDLISWGAYTRAGRAGTIQADSFKSHTHKGNPALQGNPSAHGGRPISVGSTTNWGAYYPSVQHSGGSETRPVNIAMPIYFKIA